MTLATSPLSPPCPPPPLPAPTSLWLLPHAFSLLGWLPAAVAVTGIALSTAYSGSLFTRLFLATPGTVLFGDIAEAAAGPRARALCYTIGALGVLRGAVIAGSRGRCCLEALLRPRQGRARVRCATRSVRACLWYCPIFAALGASSALFPKAPPAGSFVQTQTHSLTTHTVYTLDGTRCVILHLAATQSLEHALGAAAPPLWQCGLIVLLLAAVASQIRALSELSGFFLLGTTAQVGGAGLSTCICSC